jgi:23S rRNA (cytidine1920-2'-O)/16S rRNA (cytidine1409-2'-O)-methyltransferase
VVRSADDRRAALVSVGGLVRDRLGLEVLGYASSGLPGPAGNRESFIWIAEAGRAGAVGDLEAAARTAEP